MMLNSIVALCGQASKPGDPLGHAASSTFWELAAWEGSPFPALGSDVPHKAPPKGGAPSHVTLLCTIGRPAKLARGSWIDGKPLKPQFDNKLRNKLYIHLGCKENKANNIGCRQVVRQRVLVSPSGGSNPSTLGGMHPSPACSNAMKRAAQPNTKLLGVLLEAKRMVLGCPVPIS